MTLTLPPVYVCVCECAHTYTRVHMHKVYACTASILHVKEDSEPVLDKRRPADVLMVSAPGAPQRLWRQIRLLC